MCKVMIAMLTLSLALTGHAEAKASSHWSYSGETGPSHWGGLEPDYKACAEGRNQSPIDLKGFIESDLPPVVFHYQPGGKEVLNNGHAVQANYAPGSTISLDGREFELKQFHFHAPSENLINGQSYPMEAHLVHADRDGNLAVVAVMFETGKNNRALAKLWELMPEQAGDKHNLANLISVEGVMPAQRDYYRFNGSLTTPPCSEGVVWLVLKQPVEVSLEQVEEFEHVMHHPNNRPVQSVNARPILQ